MDTNEVTYITVENASRLSHVRISARIEQKIVIDSEANAITTFLLLNFLFKISIGIPMYTIPIKIEDIAPAMNTASSEPYCISGVVIIADVLSEADRGHSIILM